MAEKVNKVPRFIKKNGEDSSCTNFTLEFDDTIEGLINETVIPTVRSFLCQRN